MGSVYYGIPEQFALWLKNKFNIKHFIETGTGGGATMRWAAQHFEDVITIEASPTIYAKLDHIPRNVTTLCGDSSELLAKNIVPMLKDPCMFWLDAHWDGGDTFFGNECPLLDEIAAINESPLSHVILIDDARYFLYPPPPSRDYHKWPRIAGVIERLNDDWMPRRRDTFVKDDVIWSVDADLSAEVKQYLHLNGEAP